MGRPSANSQKHKKLPTEEWPWNVPHWNTLRTYTCKWYGIISGFKLEHRSTKITHEKRPSEDGRFYSREFLFTQWSILHSYRRQSARRQNRVLRTLNYQDFRFRCRAIRLPAHCWLPQHGCLSARIPRGQGRESSVTQLKSNSFLHGLPLLYRFLR